MGWGPAERIARLRCLRTIVHLLLGPCGLPLKVELRRAGASEVALVPALD